MRAACSFFGGKYEYKQALEYRYTWNGFIQGRIGDIRLREDKIHKTQKPVPLCEEILRDYAKEGQLILDCYSGSASTAIACMNLGLDFICVEKNKHMCELSKERILKHIPERKILNFNQHNINEEQLSMFSAEEI